MFFSFIRRLYRGNPFQIRRIKTNTCYLPRKMTLFWTYFGKKNSELSSPEQLCKMSFYEDCDQQFIVPFWSFENVSAENWKSDWKFSMTAEKVRNQVRYIISIINKEMYSLLLKSYSFISITIIHQQILEFH